MLEMLVGIQVCRKNNSIIFDNDATQFLSIEYLVHYFFEQYKGLLCADVDKGTGLSESDGDTFDHLCRN